MPTTPTFTVNPSTDLSPITVSSVFGIGGYQMNPWYCATFAAAERFVTYLKDKLGLVASVSWDWPLGTWGSSSPFQQNGMVPYIDIPSAVNPLNGHLNAGQTFTAYFQVSNTTADGVLQEWLALQ